MSPDYKAGMMRAAEICSAKAKAHTESAKLIQNTVDRLESISKASGMGQMAIAIYEELESGAGEDKT